MGAGSPSRISRITRAAWPAVVVTAASSATMGIPSSPITSYRLGPGSGGRTPCSSHHARKAARPTANGGSRAGRQVAMRPPIPPSKTSTDTNARPFASATAPRNKDVDESPEASTTTSQLEKLETCQACVREERCQFRLLEMTSTSAPGTMQWRRRLRPCILRRPTSRQSNEWRSRLSGSSTSPSTSVRRTMPERTRLSAILEPTEPAPTIATCFDSIPGARPDRTPLCSGRTNTRYLRGTPSLGAL